MGLIDLFTPEDKVEMTFSQFHSLVRESVKSDLLINGLKNKVPHEYMLAMMEAEESEETKDGN